MIFFSLLFSLFFDGDFKCPPALCKLLKKQACRFITRKNLQRGWSVVSVASYTMCFVGFTCFEYLTFSTPSATQKLGKENRLLFVQNRASLSRFSSFFPSVVGYQDLRECSLLCISLQRRCSSNYNGILKSARNCEFLFLTFKVFLLKWPGSLFLN